MKDLKDLELIAPVSCINDVLVLSDSKATAFYAGLYGWSRASRHNELDGDELKEAIEIAKERSKRFYISFNLIPGPLELNQAKKVLENMFLFKPDAFIVTDIGIIKFIRENGFEVHASLGCTSINKEDVRFLMEIGAKRVVLSPHLDMENIKDIAKEINPANLEVMIWGTRCKMSIMGICRISSYFDLEEKPIGTRYSVWEGSPKRSGICFKSCAQFELDPYTCSELYSPKELFKIGIRYFKMGGRGMKPQYLKNLIEGMYEELRDLYSCRRY